MKNYHTIDLDFKYCSKNLKLFLKDNSLPEIKYALEIPCGNGRNTFFLATKFENVKGVDINKAYLDGIESRIKNYKDIGNITLENSDVITRIPNLSNYRFICNIHFFKSILIQQIIQQMLPGSLLYVETPSCMGENFLELPSFNDIKSLFINTQLLFF